MTPGASSALEGVRNDLLARIAALDATLAELGAGRGAETADDEHDPEGATLSQEWSRLAGLRSDAAARLVETESALAALAEGTYGVCVDCGTRIPPERLEARPSADRCVPCAVRAGG